ncbi:MAG TPA: DUF423 domain-containing protein [Cyclobacteriaceae bacterium]
MTLQKRILLFGGVFGGLAIAIGAFGAHALKDTLIANDRLDTFELATRYQFYHALALLILGTLADRIDQVRLNWSSRFFLCGIVVFSGSLYVLSLSGNTLWGTITPIGGVFLLIGWLLFVLACLK